MIGLSLLKKESELGLSLLVCNIWETAKTSQMTGRVCFSMKAKNNLLLGDGRGGVIMAGG